MTETKNQTPKNRDEDLKRFIGPKAEKYFDLYDVIRNGRFRFSFNVWAFLAPPAFCLYRGMYTAAAVFVLIFLGLLEFFSDGLFKTAMTGDVLQTFLVAFDAMFLPAFVNIMMILMLITAFLADYLYLLHAHFGVTRAMDREIDPETAGGIRKIPGALGLILPSPAWFVWLFLGAFAIVMIYGPVPETTGAAG